MITGMTPAIEASGYGISGDIGGIKKNTYFTPDGRIIRTTPQMRDYVIKNKEGKILETGTRDANLDKGWLLQMPQIKKLFCPTCDRWHDTKVEVQACKIAQDKMIKRMTKKVKREETGKTSDLEKKVSELTSLVEKLLEEKSVTTVV